MRFVRDTKGIEAGLAKMLDRKGGNWSSEDGVFHFIRLPRGKNKGKWLISTRDKVMMELIHTTGIAAPFKTRREAGEALEKVLASK